MNSNISKIVIYRSYDLLFSGYFEYSLKVFCEINNLPLCIFSPRKSKTTYSPRDKGYRGQFYFEIYLDNGLIRKAVIDVSDGYNDIRWSLCGEVDVYFKTNFRNTYLHNLEKSHDLKSKIKKGPFFIPINFISNKSNSLTYFLKTLIEMSGFDKESNLINDFKRSKTNLNRYKNLKTRKDISFYFNSKSFNEFEFDVYYSASTWHEEDMPLAESRAEIIRTLRNIKEFKVHAEFIYNKSAKEIWPELMIDYRRPIEEYYNLLLKSKIIIIHKSLSGGALSWRLGECLALGKVFIHEYTENDIYAGKILDSEYGVFYNQEDLLYKINHILKNKDLFEKMQRNSILLFENFYNPINNGSYLVNSLLES